MIPVFLTTRARDPLRILYAAACINYWTRHVEVEPFTIINAGCDRRLWHVVETLDPDYHEARPMRWKRIDIPEEGSQRTRHVVAWEAAQELGAEWYIQVDDDIMPRPEFTATVAMDLLRLQGGYGLVSAYLPACPVDGHEPERHNPYRQPIADTACCGAIRFMRTEMPLEFPPLEHRPEGSGYDEALCLAVRAAGYKTGAFSDQSPQHLRVTHLADTYSTVWKCLFPVEQFPRTPL